MGRALQTMLKFRWNFDDVHDRLRYQFGHLFLMIFGIGFDSILASFWYRNPCFGAIVFGDGFLSVLI